MTEPARGLAALVRRAQQAENAATLQLMLDRGFDDAAALLLVRGIDDPQPLRQLDPARLESVWRALRRRRGCQACGAERAHRCTACRAVRYCSEACSRQCWPEQHRPFCRVFAPHLPAFRARRQPQ